MIWQEPTTENFQHKDLTTHYDILGELNLEIMLQFFHLGTPGKVLCLFCTQLLLEELFNAFSKILVIML